MRYLTFLGLAVFLVSVPVLVHGAEWYDTAGSEGIGVTRLQWNLLKLQNDALGYLKQDGVTPYISFDSNYRIIRVELDHHSSILKLQREALTDRFQQEVDLIHSLISHLFPKIDLFNDVNIEFWTRDPNDPAISISLGRYSAGTVELEDR